MPGPLSPDAEPAGYERTTPNRTWGWTATHIFPHDSLFSHLCSGIVLLTLCTPFHVCIFCAAFDPDVTATIVAGTCISPGRENWGWVAKPKIYATIWTLPPLLSSLRWRQSFTRHSACKCKFKCSITGRPGRRKTSSAFAYRFVPDRVPNFEYFPCMLINEVRTFCRLGG